MPPFVEGQPLDVFHIEQVLAAAGHTGDLQSLDEQVGAGGLDTLSAYLRTVVEEVAVPVGFFTADLHRRQSAQRLQRIALADAADTFDSLAGQAGFGPRLVRLGIEQHMPALAGDLDGLQTQSGCIFILRGLVRRGVRKGQT